MFLGKREEGLEGYITISIRATGCYQDLGKKGKREKERIEVRGGDIAGLY